LYEWNLIQKLVLWWFDRNYKNSVSGTGKVQKVFSFWPPSLPQHNWLFPFLRDRWAVGSYVTAKNFDMLYLAQIRMDFII
jgi:hypothetical protein